MFKALLWIFKESGSLMRVDFYTTLVSKRFKINVITIKLVGEEFHNICILKNITRKRDYKKNENNLLNLWSNEFLRISGTRRIAPWKISPWKIALR